MTTPSSLPAAAGPRTPAAALSCPTLTHSAGSRSRVPVGGGGRRCWRARRGRARTAGRARARPELPRGRSARLPLARPTDQAGAVRLTVAANGSWEATPSLQSPEVPEGKGDGSRSGPGEKPLAAALLSQHVADSAAPRPARRRPRAAATGAALTRYEPGGAQNSAAGVRERERLSAVRAGRAEPRGHPWP